MPGSLETLNRFGFEGKGWAHYVFLGVTILIPVFIIVSVVICIRTPIPKRKWLWVIFILVGIGQMTLNWTTGERRFTPASVHLFAASATWASEYAPVLLSFSIPLGAVVFWVRRRAWLEIARVKAAETA